jgi:hypothetical protein
MIKKGEMGMHGLKSVMIVAGFVALVTGGTGFLAWADSRGGHDPHGTPSHPGLGHGDGQDKEMGHHGGLSPLAMKESLGLSDEQVNRLRPLEIEYRKTMIQNGADLGVAMVDLGHSWMPSNPRWKRLPGRLMKLASCKRI